MRGSFQIAKFFGIPVQVHWSFGLIFAWIWYEAYMDGRGWQEILQLTLLVIAIFACVVLHEFGHALTAKRFGVSTRDIILSPIGGIARLDRLPEKPIQELLVAIAGPLVNIAIAAILLFYLLVVATEPYESLLGVLSRSSNSFRQHIHPVHQFLVAIVFMNGLLAGFNMIPAFPMDGGRVLRALLAIRLGHLRATRAATYVGFALAILIGIAGFVEQNFMLMLIGGFVLFMGMMEYRMAKTDASLDTFPVVKLMRSEFSIFYQTDQMALPAHAFSAGLEHNFLIFDDWQNLKGILTEAQIQKAVEHQQLDSAVLTFATNGFMPLLAGDTLRHALEQMQHTGYTMLPVYENDKIVGVLDYQAIHRFLRKQSKLFAFF